MLRINKMLGFCLLMLNDDDDRLKFIALYNRYHNIFTSVAMGILEDFHDAEEAVQTAFVAIARNIDRLDTTNEKLTDSYMYRTIRRICYNTQRKRGRIPQVLESVDEDTLPSDDDVARNVSSKESFTMLVNLVRSMPVTYRDVLVLNLLCNISPTNIAKMLDMPPSTVRSLLRRGSEKLKKAIEEAGING